MTLTPIADMVEEMLSQQVLPTTIVLAIRVAERGSALPVTLPLVTGHSLPDERSRKAKNQAAYRLRMKEKQGDGVAMAASSEPVTPLVTTGNGVAVRVTSAPLSILPSFDLSQGNPKEEKDSNKEPRARGKRLPDDWQPSDADAEYARSRKLSNAQISDEATKFRNYWTNRTDKQAAKPRWDRAWQNWIMNVKGSPNGQDKSVVGAADRALERIAQFNRREPELFAGIRADESSPDVRLLPKG